MRLKEALAPSLSRDLLCRYAAYAGSELRNRHVPDAGADAPADGVRSAAGQGEHTGQVNDSYVAWGYSFVVPGFIVR
ncbi:MAG TPA: hypothetical protein VGU23_10885, partial [Acidobacteriaceae bacterium]|nr:hypothetical protein [Acidobacteriaceae bacterium]